MFGNNPSAKWLWLLAGLVVANVAYYFYENWGLVTVKVTDVPLKEVISSIEWQAWVKIYSNLPPDTKVTMYADHVPLAEAMETLAANVDVPPPPDDGTRPQRNRGNGFASNGGGTNNAPMIGQAGPPPGAPGPDGAGQGPGPGGGAPGQGPGGGGAPGGGRGGFGGGFGGGGGFGRRAEWNLAFFVGPTAADVKNEIRQFEAGDPDVDAKVYTNNTQMQMIADDTVTATPDPHAQSWPGYKPPDPATVAANAANLAQMGNAPVDPPANTPPTVHTYLSAFAQAANIWIMATGSWAPEVSTPPAPDSSIIRAVENFVSSSHGAVTEAIVLRAGPGGPRGSNGGGDSWEDRMTNAISGLPPDQRPEALDQLHQEVAFRKTLDGLPPEQRRQKMFAHMIERMLYADRSRLSPERRARMYARMISMREAAKAAKQ